MASPAVLYARRLVQSKWTVMVLGTYLMAFAAAVYNFSVYSQSIKAAMSLDQRELNTISFFLGVGDGVGFLAGLLSDRWQPWGVMLLGVPLNAGGYLLAWMGITGRLFGGISRLRVWHLCLFLAIGANGQTFGEMAVMVVVFRNFPSSRGTVMGLVKGFYGLSGAILPQIYYAVFWDDPTSFLLLAACLPSVISFVCMPFMQHPSRPVNDLQARRDAAIMRSLHAIAIAIGIYLLGVVVVQNVASLSRAVVGVLTSVMVFVLCLPVAVVLWAEASAITTIEQQHPAQSLETIHEAEQLQIRSAAEKSSHSHVDPPDCTPTTQVLPSVHQQGPGAHESASQNQFVRRWIQFSHLAAKPAARGEDHSILQALLSLDFWILFAALGCGTGAIMVLLNNMAQVGYAQGYSPAKINTMVALVNVWNFFGRIMAGSSSDALMHHLGGRYSVLASRPTVLAISITALVVGNLMLAMNIGGALYIGSILSGSSLGAQYTLTPVIVSELFGLNTVGTTYTVLASAAPLAEYVLSVRVAGALYDHQASKESLGGSLALLCKGPRCFRSTFFVMTAVTTSGVLLCAILTLRTMSFYRKICIATTA